MLGGSMFNKKNNPELAYNIFQTLMVGCSLTTFEEIKVNYAIKDCKCRQDVLNKVIEVCGEPLTPFQRYIYAIAYAWSNKEYRQLAIQYLNYYLSNELWDGALNRLRYSTQSIEERKREHLCEMYNYLFNAYIGTYEFDKALEIAEHMIEIDITNPTCHMAKCEILIKLNKLNECKEWLEAQKKLPFYKFDKKYLETQSENWFYFTINRLLNDVNEKIEKGYVYKPRKRN